MADARMMGPSEKIEDIQAKMQKELEMGGSKMPLEEEDQLKDRYDILGMVGPDRLGVYEGPTSRSPWPILALVSAIQQPKECDQLGTDLQSERP